VALTLLAKGVGCPCCLCLWGLVFE